MVKPFDSHAHLYDEAYDADRAQVLAESARELSGLIIPGADLASSHQAVELAQMYGNVYAAVGFHPHEARLMREGDEDMLAESAKDKKVVAIGEIGLDYYYDHSPRETQKAVFIRQLGLARQLGLPVVIHDRDAHGDILAIMQKEGRGVSGVFHCYSGSWEMAELLLKMGFYLSFGGSLTFKNAAKTVKVAQNTPIDRILLETDAPYLTPVPWRGRRNSPCLVKLVCAKLAALKGLSFEETAGVTAANTCALFNILPGLEQG
ncbi:MAG: TatD family hydrolase [Acidaminococcales bacterium]|jgi:TatD DNase family protein|nr:TatD family hydrolase [Acidaminococcales bacterium]